MGLWEAGQVYFVPSIRQFLFVDATYVVWFLAPLVDMALFVLLGAILGAVATLRKFARPGRTLFLGAALPGAAGAWIGWAHHFLHTHGANLHVYYGPRAILFPLIRFAIVYVLALIVAKLLPRRILPFARSDRAWPLRTFAVVLGAIFAVLVGGVAFYAQRAWPQPSPETSRSGASRAQPNIVLIIMDTVRADHLSCYGYSRPTTPNIDRLARHGVLFENAIAASSWTLPSFASMFTGLLPQQSGADAYRPLNLNWVTAAEVLARRGFATAGFTANYFYGETGWGLGNGFEQYDDDRTTVPYNLSRTLAGRVLVQPIYQATERYDGFQRRDASELNADVFRWLRGRSAQPFFISINYFDAHAPYLVPAPYNRRFGELPRALIRRIALRAGFRPSKPFSASENAELIAGYDNSLAYLDDQIGQLLEFLRSSPNLENTIVIVTSDHGEAFGEHGAYQHGYDLHREEIHVPLVIAGPGIPAGRRIADVSGTQDLFATVLNLCLGKWVPFDSRSLSRFWTSGSPPKDSEETVVSELSASLGQPGLGSLSLTTPQWHYIRSSQGQQELYRWDTDPAESNDLSSQPASRATLEGLQAQLLQSSGRAYGPWLGPEYLLALGAPERELTPGENMAGGRPGSQLDISRTGWTQAYFAPNIAAASRGLSPGQDQLLKSLPYQ